MTELLQPLDIGIVMTHPRSLYDRLEVWALGDPYTHVLMYLGTEAIAGRKVLYESVGRGVILSNPAAYFGREMVFMRPQVAPAQAAQVVQSALDIACDEDSYYEYVQAAREGLSLILAKFHLPVPLKYQRISFISARKPWPRLSGETIS